MIPLRSSSPLLPQIHHATSFLGMARQWSRINALQEENGMRARPHSVGVN